MVKSLNESVKYIGVDDLDLDLFESQYVVPEGMAYNSYLILDEKAAILDTADARKGEAWKVRLQEALTAASRTIWLSTTWNRTTPRRLPGRSRPIPA